MYDPTAPEDASNRIRLTFDANSCIIQTGNPDPILDWTEEEFGMLVMDVLPRLRYLRWVMGKSKTTHEVYTAFEKMVMAKAVHILAPNELELYRKCVRLGQYNTNKTYVIGGITNNGTKVIMLSAKLAKIDDVLRRELVAKGYDVNMEPGMSEKVRGGWVHVDLKDVDTLAEVEKLRAKMKADLDL